MEIKKGKVILFLLGCLLLAGCGREAESEGEQADVPGETIIAAADRIGYAKVNGEETADAVMADEEETNLETVEAEPEDALHRSMIVISVLGKEELAIETERLYADKSRPGYLDNRFTPEEIDIILNTIEGTWSVDEYVGFAPYAMTEQWMGEGTYEEKRERYRESKEWAEKNLPDFFFQVKNGSGKESAASSQYIYVYGDNKVYASPMSIILSKQEEEKPQGSGRTIQGAGIPMQAYPVIYIEFFSISCSEEGNISYEPATLVLASDGSFLLLKNGAFYSLKNNIQCEIMSGNFEHLDDDKEYIESIEKTYDWIMNGLGNCQWRRIDLNGDGIEDLILEEAEPVTVGSEEKRIIGIFACEKDEAKCILWDVNDSTEYYFCGSTGELMYSASDYGGVVSTEPYTHCYFDREWNEIRDYDLVVYMIDAAMNEDYAKEWKQENPDMAEDGIYYRKYTGENVEILTREELESMYEAETGYKLYSEFQR